MELVADNGWILSMVVEVIRHFLTNSIVNFSRSSGTVVAVI